LHVKEFFTGTKDFLFRNYFNPGGPFFRATAAACPVGLVVLAEMLVQARLEMGAGIAR
jgi:hypothetical protein